MRYKEGIDKQQLSLMPVCLDDYIPEDHICRVIYAFIKTLDLVEFKFKYAECKDTGRQPYDPRMMLALYIYGYLHRVRSSRRLRDEARRNVEVMWLMDGLTPDDKTICNFRTDNLEALKKTFRSFVRMCREMGLYGGELEATDSTKFRANNSLKNHYNKPIVEKELTRIEEKINEYLKVLEEGDRQESGEREPGATEIREALKRLEERKEQYTKLKEQVAKEGEVATVDPDARMMRSGGDARKLDVCYNVHTVVDSKHHLIVDYEVSTCSSDSKNLHSMSEKVKEALEVETFTNLADKGYYDSEDIAACEASGVTCLVAKPESGPKKAEGFNHDDFTYDREKDCYSCPCGQELSYKRNGKKNGDKEYRIYANYGACGACPQKAQCTSYRYREMWRLDCQDIVDIVNERTRKNKGLYRKWQEIVEHPFGTVKAVWGYKQFLCRGKAKVTAETALAYLAYNMRRFVNIVAEKRAQRAVS